MKKVNVNNNKTGLSFSGSFPDHNTALNWVDSQTNHKSWGESPDDYTIEILDYNTTDEKWRQLRQTRNNKLQACDWTMISDVPMSAGKREEWLTYRQQLRDLTTNTVHPDDVVWPNEPK